MDIFLALLGSFCLLVFSVFQGYLIIYPLLITFFILIAVLLKRGFPFNCLMQMAFAGSRKSFPVLSILLLIGAITAIWLAAGTVPAIVYYGIQLIHPRYFILSAFILSSLVSLLIGTSFGTVGTIGLALMIMARGSDVDSHIIAGAVIAGAYFGDRCSPMSSSANLIASITSTDLYTNIRRMILSGWLPLLLSCLLYLIWSVLNPVHSTETNLLSELDRLFDLNGLVLLPAITILVLAAFQVEVKRSMLVSIGVGILIALRFQSYDLRQLLGFSVTGFHLAESSPLQQILVGGGILSMLKVSVIVLVSTAIAGILAETQVLQGVEVILQKSHSRSRLFLNTILIGTAAAALGCTQTIAITLTQQLVQKRYVQHQLSATDLAIDLENTVVVLSPLIPWNIAGLIPATLLLTDAGFIPYACYLYLVPLVSWFVFCQWRRRENFK